MWKAFGVWIALSTGLSAAPNCKIIVQPHFKPGKAFLIDLKGTCGENCVEKVLELIATTPMGEKLMAEFLPRDRSGEIQIELTRKLPLFASPRAAALFQYNAGTKTKKITLNPTATYGELLGHLVHEMTHSLDDPFLVSHEAKFRKRQAIHAEMERTLAEMEKPQGSQEQMRKLQKKALDHLGQLTQAGVPDDQETFRTERRAYDVQFAYLMEFAARFPCASEYLEEALGKRPSDDIIRKEYNLKSHSEGE